MAEERVLLDAEFNPKVRHYWLLAGTFVLIVTVVGIPLLLIWLPFGLYLTQRYLDRMRCTLTTRSLKVEKGLLVRQEKNISLDKITDVGLVQGPIMRLFEIESIAIETAGQTVGGRPNLRLDGIREGREFRNTVLRQRDKVVAYNEEGGAVSTSSAAGTLPDSADVLRDIRDTLHRIESNLTDRHSSSGGSEESK